MSDANPVEVVERGGQDPIQQTLELSVETTTLLEQYKITADWIRFADAKAAVLLGVQGVLVGYPFTA